MLRNEGALIRSRSNSREQSIDRILDATIEVISQRGLEKLNLTDVCQRAGVSRTTLYRFFPTKEVLLDAYFSRETRRFEQSIVEAIRAEPDVTRRLRAMYEFRPSPDGVLQVTHLLELEPGFVLHFLRRLRPHMTAVLEDALAPLFDEVARHGLVLDRKIVVEMLLRVQMSLYLLPSKPSDPAPGNAVVELLESLPGWPKPGKPNRR